MGGLVGMQYQLLPFALPDNIFSQDMTGIAPLLGMFEMRLYRSLVNDISSHFFGLILAAEQHAGLAYSCAPLEGAVKDVMLVGQILCILYCQGGGGPRFG